MRLKQTNTQTTQKMLKQTQTTNSGLKQTHIQPHHEIYIYIYICSGLEKCLVSTLHPPNIPPIIVRSSVVFMLSRAHVIYIYIYIYGVENLLVQKLNLTRRQPIPPTLLQKKLAIHGSQGSLLYHQNPVEPDLHHPWLRAALTINSVSKFEAVIANTKNLLIKIAKKTAKLNKMFVQDALSSCGFLEPRRSTITTAIMVVWKHLVSKTRFSTTGPS